MKPGNATGVAARRMASRWGRGGDVAYLLVVSLSFPLYVSLLVACDARAWRDLAAGDQRGCLSLLAGGAGAGVAGRAPRRPPNTPDTPC